LNFKKTKRKFLDFKQNLNLIVIPFRLQSHTQAVNEAFRICVEKGLIYRGNYLVHWSPALRSVLSDIEVDHLEVAAGKKFLEVPSGKALVGQMFDVAYRVVGSEDEFVTVSTTRPETILGDVAVAVHPEDPRYADLLNRQAKLQHPLRTDAIPLVADSQGVDPQLGTGAVKITPCHDSNDFQVGQRLGLPNITMLDEKGLVCFSTESHFQLTSDGESFLVSLLAKLVSCLYMSTPDPSLSRSNFFN
jgi:valyl-tRNA synthetase